MHPLPDATICGSRARLDIGTSMGSLARLWQREKSPARLGRVGLLIEAAWLSG
jgi:hypothetical protein